MGYFPFFMDISGKRCIIIGGGTVALRKIEKLLPFGPEITVIAPEIRSEISELSGVKTVRRCFEERDLEGVFMAVSASDSEELNARIFELCRAKNILVNTVDDRDKCGFIFPALVHKNDVTVGISTSGTSPLYARFLREQIESLLDEHYLSIGELLSRYRPIIRHDFETESARKKAAEALLEMCLIDGQIPSDAEINAMLEEMKRHEN